MTGPAETAERIAPIDALRLVRDLVLEQPDRGLWPIAAAIDDWLASGGDFALALGLAPGWHAALRQRHRDATLRSLVLYFPGLCGRGLAKAMAIAAADYESRRWPRDRADRRRPDGKDGLLFDLLMMGHMPAEETLRKCIG